MMSADRVRSRRTDVKTLDREKSLSPLDKDELKLRCLQRVRNERHKFISKMRERQSSPGGDTMTSNLATVLESSTEIADNNSNRRSNGSTGPSELALSSARQILRFGLIDIRQAAFSGKRLQLHQVGQQTDAQHQKLQPPATPEPTESLFQSGGAVTPSRQCHATPPTPPTPPLTMTSTDSSSQRAEDPSAAAAVATATVPMEMAEEQAYRTACSSGAERTPSRRTPLTAPAGSLFQTGAAMELSGSGRRGEVGEREPAGVRTGVGSVGSRGQDDGREGQKEGGGGQLVWGKEELLEDEKLLSPEEYSEMMRYIEEACRQEDLRAEAKVLHEYERTRRLEEDALEYAVASNLDDDGLSQDGVLCPICKRNYLLQAGPPSASIVCACGFRLDTRGDRLSLEYVRQQLAETYAEHSAGCSAEPTFSVEGTSNLEILWSACDGCGFARVVI